MKKLLLCVLFAGACGGEGEQLFPPKPECMGSPITPFTGTFPQVISKLAIGSLEDGFDLDHDGKPDNKLAAVSSLAQSAIDDSFKNYEIVIPIEYFDLPAVAKDDCVKFAIYLADYDKDGDGDGKRPGIDGGDCNDHDPEIKPGATEVMNDGKDNDCDGLADEDDQNNPNTTDNRDQDGDGQSVAQGDCDDHDNTVKKGAVEICGDGKDNDCDGVADYTKGMTVCGAYDAMRDLKLNPLSLDTTGKPIIAFNSGAIDGANKLVAGPSIFSVNIPVTNGLTLDLRITGATIEADLSSADATTMNGRLGGVIDAKTADTIRGLNVDQIGLKPENSLLDATFANLLGPLLALPKAKASVLKKYPGCRTPDIDVDGDGLEAFCDSNPNDDIKKVDVCIDGDGTEIHDTDTTECTQAMKDGKPRFVDGISVELNFSTTKVHSLTPP